MTSADRHYTGAAGHQYHIGKRFLPAAAVPWVANLRAEKLQPHVHPTDPVFEYGAGYAWNLLSLRCARRIGYDISEHSGSDDKTIEWTRELASIPTESVDVIICHHALEHLVNPAEALGTMRNLLRSGGRLLLFVPFEKERRYRHFDPGEPNHHLYSWNAQTLGNLITESAFKLESIGIGEFGYDRFAANLAIKLKMREGTFRLIRRMTHLLKRASEVRCVAVRT